MFVEFTEQPGNRPLRIAVAHITAYHPIEGSESTSQAAKTCVWLVGGPSFYVGEVYGSINLMVQQALLDQARAMLLGLEPA